jgi:hypothetical protein
VCLNACRPKNGGSGNPSGSDTPIRSPVRTAPTEAATTGPVSRFSVPS